MKINIFTFSFKIINPKIPCFRATKFNLNNRYCFFFNDFLRATFVQPKLYFFGFLSIW